MSHNESKEQPTDIANLQENFSKQQEKISALKELVRKSEVAHGKSTTSAQEKVKSIAQQLTHLKSKARSRQHLDVPSPQQQHSQHQDDEQSMALHQHLSIMTPSSSHTSTPNPTTSPKPQQKFGGSNTSLTTTPSAGSEKIMLLRQQMEENKARMAQRASSKLHLEQLVTQLKEKFDTTQQYLEDTTEMGKSMSDLSAFVYVPTSTTRERHRSATDLTTQPFSLEKERMKFLENRCRLLEKQLEKERQANSTESAASESSSKVIKELENKILEMDELLKERQNAIEAKVLVEKDLTTENSRLNNEIALRKAEIEVLRTKVDVSEQPSEDFSNDISDLLNENDHLHNELAEKGRRIAELEEVNDMLETTRCDLTMKNNQNEELIQQLQENLLESKEKVQQLQDELQQSEIKFAALQENLATIESNASETHTTKATLDTDTQVQVEMAKQIQELQDELKALKTENSKLKNEIDDNDKLEVSDASIAEKISALEATIESQRDDLKKRHEIGTKYEEELMEKTIELNVLNANFKVLEEKLQGNSKNKRLFSTTGTSDTDNTELQAEIQQVKRKLDDSNKAMIKLKLKCKQSEKLIEKLKKNSNLHAEIVNLQKRNEDLQHKITELEDEKGQWQLMQVVDVAESTEDAKNAATNLDEKCKTQAETIRLLEEQKYDHNVKLNKLQEQVQTLQQQLDKEQSEETARVKSQMSEIHLEEQLEEQTQQLQMLKEKLSIKELELEEQQQRLRGLTEDKQNLDKKLEHYINENIELLDKVEKLSKSSSSAESIEIVERLTQQERAEIDEFNKRHEHEHDHEPHTGAEHAISSVNELTQTEMGPELSESLAKLREESSELMNKIELFTTERREVLEKMEHLTTENQELQRKVEEVMQEKELLETNVLLAENAKSKLEVKLQETHKEKELLACQVAESTAQKAQLSQELTSLQKSSEVVAALDSSDGTALFAKCEKSLSKLNSELVLYHKANDRNAKFNASKKLAKEAKNAYTQLSQLLQKVKEASSAVETVTVVETVVAVTAPNGKALAEYEQLTAQNRQLKATVEELRRALQQFSTDPTDTTDTNYESTLTITEVPAAITQGQYETTQEQLKAAQDKTDKFEERCITLQASVESLRLQLQEARSAGDERTTEITQLRKELAELQKINDDLDRLINDKEMSHEKQIEQLTRLRRELEGKCETYEGEMEILQTLVKEQKQQLIESYKESEHEMNLKLLDLQQRDEQITELRAKLQELKNTSIAAGEDLTKNLQMECEKLRESLKISKALVAEQVNELTNKQETIETVNLQIIDLYKTIEENTNKLIEKDDEIVYLQDLVSNNSKELERFNKDSDEQKSVVDRLLSELHAHKENIQNLPQLESDLQRANAARNELEALNKELETRNKDQLEKLKKFAANLKKRAAQCHEYEAKIKEMEEKGAVEAMQTKEHTDTTKQDLEEFKTNNMLQNERIKELELRLKQTETETNEIKEALQVKTSEYLENIENNAKLEREVKQLRENLHATTQETVQLQNALAATQDQASGWSDFAEETTSTNNESVIKELREKLALQEEKLLSKTKELEELRITQAQASDWDDFTLESTSNESARNTESLTKELAIKTTNLEVTELALNEVQAELMQMREMDQARQQALSEMQTTIQLKIELEESLQKQLENGQKELQVLQEQLETENKHSKELSEELKAKSLKFEKSKAVIKERNNQIHRLQAQIKDLQGKLSAQPEEEAEQIEQPISQQKVHASMTAPTVVSITKEEFDSLKQAHDKLNEKYNADKAAFEETIARLETLHDGIQAKLQEDLSYIETLEQENSKFKEKICKLEECVACFEERRASMERRVNVLDAQMQSRADEYEKTEDELIYRLNMLSEHDDVIAQRLLSSQEEKDELLDKLSTSQTEFKDLEVRFSKLANDHQNNIDNVTSNLETELTHLRQQHAAVETENQRMRSTYEAKLAAKTTELDELECELNDQLTKMNTEKRTLCENLERSRDECTLHKDEIVRLKESLNAFEQSKQELEREVTWLRMQIDSSEQDQYELQELRMQTMQDKTETDNLRHQIETLAANHEIELQGLRTQISELDTLRMQVGQNQTDDQVFIETENKRLTDLLAEKEALIDNYQRQNLQLQMATSSTTSAQTQLDPLALAFGNTTIANTNPAMLTNEERDRLDAELHGKTELATRLQRDFNALQAEFHALLEGNTELQRQLAESNHEIENMRSSGITAATTAFPNDVIPAPPMFFASDQTTPSPFDEIVQVRQHENTLEANAHHHAVINPNAPLTEQPTIEDLQRNVSDLEKHAQDLENKLAMRNQRESDFDEKLREVQTRLHDSDNRIREREQQLQNAQLEMQQMKQETHTLTQQQNDLRHSLQTLQWQLNNAEQQLKEREEQLKDMHMKLEFYSASNDNSAAVNVTDQLRDNITRLEGILQQREEELADLKKQLNDEKHLKSTAAALEQQILTMPSEETQVDSFAASVGPTLDMFFGNAGASEFENLIIPPVENQLVVEDVIVPEKAYICYPDSGQTQTAATTTTTATPASTELDLGDDWGDSWSKEAEAEAKHFATTAATTTATARQSLVPREQQLELQLQEKLELIQELELSLERSEQQKQELQVKSGKLMKKLKEYKSKVDDMQASNVFKKSTSLETNSMFDDLDAAIQDELKAQIKLLESKLEEQVKNQDNFTAEKDKLLKRIDVLTAGNERMSDMKERQDMDVQMYQARIRELQNKLNTLEDWDKETQVAQPEQISASPTQVSQVKTATSLEEAQSWKAKQHDYENKIVELSVTIQDVTADREELKALLEEEEANVKRAEEIVRTLQQQITQANESTNLEKSQHNELKLSYQNLQEKYNNIYEQNEKLNIEVKTLKTECERLMQEEQTNVLLPQSDDASNQQDVQNEMQSLREALQFTEQASSELQIQMLALRTHNQELTQANAELQAATATLTNTNNELEQFKELNQELQNSKRQLEQQAIELQAEIAKLQTHTLAKSSDGRCDELAAQLQEKESEILHLKQRIEDLMREDQTEKLVLEILTKNQEIHMLKMQVKHLEEDKQELEHNVSLKNTKDLQTEKDSNAEVVQQQERIKQLEQQVKETQEEKSNMEEELKVLNNHVISSLELEDKMKITMLELDTKNIEIAELRKSLEKMKEQNVNTELNSNSAKAVPEVDIVALNSQWESTVEQRCGEIAQMWQQYMQQREEEFKAVEVRLNEELTTLRTSNNMNTAQQQQQQQQHQQQHVISAETTATSTPASESTSPSGTSSNAHSKEGTPLRTRIINEENEADADAIIEKMQAALESQEIEIVTLKEQLAIRSAEYARLAAQYDPFKLQNTLSHSGMTTTITGPSSLDSSQVKRNATGNVASSLVPKSELDLALYMLHQRDMRCEEMTVELVSLLEERDTLQLKLSNTLRQMEAIKTQTNYTEPIPASQANVAAGFTDNTDSSPSSLIDSRTIASDSTHELNQKLSQLQTVNHSKDKLIKEEREQRQRQMEKIQQDVAKMPPAAVSELIGTDLSQSNQSPSSVLLNWLWGNKPDSNIGTGGGGNLHN